MDDAEIQSKITDLQKRHAALVQRRANLTGLLQGKKDELSKIVEEIKEAGYDPKKIGHERDRVREELLTMINQLDTELSESETAMSGFPVTK
jgi:chromosome segregation ATPase